MSESCAFGYLCAGLHIANGGNNLRFSFVVRILDEPIRAAARPETARSHRAHNNQFWLAPHTAETPSDSRFCVGLHGDRILPVAYITLSVRS